MRSSIIRTVLLCAGISLSAAGASQTGPGFKMEHTIDELITSALARYNIPGGSIAIIDDGHVVYAKGFGTISLTAYPAALP